MNKTAIRRSAVHALSWLVLVAPAQAADSFIDCAQGEMFAWENDYLGRGKVGTDRWYTDGLHAAWSYKKGCNSPTLDTLRGYGRKLLDPDARLESPTIMMTLGVNTYTPRDIEKAEPQLDDRPWANYMFGSVGAFVDDGKVHKLAELKLGVIGPAAPGSKIQSLVHRLIDDDRPAGWHNQLRPRLGLQLAYTYTKRWVEKDALSFVPPWAAIHTHARANLGTVKTLAAVGLTLVAGERRRIFGAPDEGDNMGLDFNDRRNDFEGHGPSWLKRWTVYGQAQAALVAHNVLITGDTFGGKPRIDLKREVLMFTLGFSYKCSDRTRLEYRIKWRSPEFDAPGPAPDDRIQRYGEARWVTDFDH